MFAEKNAVGLDIQGSGIFENFDMRSTVVAHCHEHVRNWISWSGAQSQCVKISSFHAVEMWQHFSH